MKSRAEQDQIQADAKDAKRKLSDTGLDSLRKALDKAEKCTPKKRKRIHKLVGIAMKYKRIRTPRKRSPSGRGKGGLIYLGGGVLPRDGTNCAEKI